jgi:hypothetical protein
MSKLNSSRALPLVGLTPYSLGTGGCGVDPADLWQGICSTTKRNPDIESGDEFSRRARVMSAGNIHDRSENSDRQGSKLSNVHWQPAALIFLETRHTFLCRTGRSHIEADPIKLEQTYYVIPRVFLHGLIFEPATL